MGMHQTDQPLISELLTLHEKQNFGVSQAELINVHFFTEFVRENSTRAPRTFPQFHLDPVHTCRLKTQIFCYGYGYRPHVYDQNDDATFGKHSPEWIFLETIP